MRGLLLAGVFMQATRTSAEDVPAPVAPVVAQAELPEGTAEPPMTFDAWLKQSERIRALQRTTRQHIPTLQKADEYLVRHEATRRIQAAYESVLEESNPLPDEIQQTLLNDVKSARRPGFAEGHSRLKRIRDRVLAESVLSPTRIPPGRWQMPEVVSLLDRRTGFAFQGLKLAPDETMYIAPGKNDFASILEEIQRNQGQDVRVDPTHHSTLLFEKSETPARILGGAFGIAISHETSPIDRAVDVHLSPQKAGFISAKSVHFVAPANDAHKNVVTVPRHPQTQAVLQYATQYLAPLPPTQQRFHLDENQSVVMDAIYARDRKELVFQTDALGFQECGFQHVSADVQKIEEGNYVIEVVSHVYPDWLWVQSPWSEDVIGVSGALYNTISAQDSNGNTMTLTPLGSATHNERHVKWRLRSVEMPKTIRVSGFTAIHEGELSFGAASQEKK